MLLSTALLPSQGGLSPRGVDPGYPYPVGCLDRMGYVRPEDVGIRDSRFLQVLASLRSNRAAEAGGLLPKLAPSDRNEEVVRAKLWVDYHILTGDVDHYWERLDREVKSYESSKVAVPFETRIAFGYCSDYFLHKYHDSKTGRVAAVRNAIEVLAKEPKSGAAVVALSSFQSSYSFPGTAVKTLRGYLSDHPRAYTVRMNLIWTLGMGSSREGSIEGPLRDQRDREALQEAKLILKQDDTYYPALLEAAYRSRISGNKVDARKYYERYLSLAPANHKLRAAVQSALDALNK